MSGSWSPFLSSSGNDAEENDFYLERELGMLERAVQDKGELPRRELGVQVLGARSLRPRVARGRQAGPAQPPAPRGLRPDLVDLSVIWTLNPTSDVSIRALGVPRTPGRA
ncbi:MAG: hypothetical protein H0U06_14270 [Solirubrobacterales bacterium]|nr:hypothetical protein [Solirubrobacterales bacterium]